MVHKDQSDEDVDEADERRPACGEANDDEQRANAIGQRGEEQAGHDADVQGIGEKRQHVVKAEEFLGAVLEEKRNSGNEPQCQQAAIDLAANGFHEQELSQHWFPREAASLNDQPIEGEDSAYFRVAYHTVGTGDSAIRLACWTLRRLVDNSRLLPYEFQIQ